MSTSKGFSFWAKEKNKAVEVIIKTIKDNTPQYLIDSPWRKWGKDDPDCYGHGWVFENGDGIGTHDNWFGEDFTLKRIEKNELKLWVDCSGTNATYDYQGKRWEYDKRTFDKIMEALKDIDCSEVYMLTSCDAGGERTRTYYTKIRKEWKGKLA